MNNDRFRRTRLLVAPALLAAILGGAGLLHAGRPGVLPLTVDPVAELVPANTAIHVMFSGAAFGNDAGKLALTQIMQEPEMLEFIAPLAGMAQGYEANAESWLTEVAGISLQEAWELSRGRLTLSLIGIETVRVEIEGYVTTEIRPDAVLTFRFGKDQSATIRRLMQRLEQQAVDSGLGRHEDAVVGGIPMRRFNPIGTGISVSYFVHDDLLIAATSEKTLEGMVLRLKGDTRGSLATVPGYQEVAKHVERPASVLTVYADPAALLGLVSDGVDESVRAMFAFSGLDTFEALGYGFDIDGRGLRDRIYMYSPERRGVVASFRVAGGQVRTDRLVPAETGLFASGAYNLQGSYDWLLEFLAQAEPHESQGMRRAIRKLERELGLSVRDDLLAALGPEYAFYAAFPKQRVVPDVGMLIQVQDRERVESVLIDLADAFAADVEMGSLDFRGHVIRYLDFGSLGHEFHRTPPVKPSWTFVDDFVLVTPWPQAAKNFIDGRARKEPRLAKRPEYAGMLAHLRADNPTAGSASITYVDFKGAIGFALDNGIPFAQSFLSTEDVPLDMARFPVTETITQHLFGIIGASHWTDTGGYSEFYSPTGIMLPYICVGAGAAFFLVGVSHADPMSTGEIEIISEEDGAEPDPPVPAPASRPVNPDKK